MSKEFKLVKQSEVAKVQKPPVDWTLCILCQKASSETLQQPWKGKGRGRGGGDAIAIGYQSFAINLAKFKDFGEIPFGVMPDQFDDGSGVVQTLQNNKAAWHKTCRNMFSDLKLERLQKRALEPEATDSSAMSPVKLRRSSGFPGTQPSERNTPVCFFCGKDAGTGGLHEVRTMGMDHTIRKYATELNDTELLAKLAPGDMVALEAKYHKGCLSDLHNRCKHVNKYRSLDPTVDTASAVKSQESIALAELISYIDERRMFDTAVPVFRLADLVAIYTERLLEFNPDVNVNSTRLKDRLLLHCPYLKAVNQGRDVLLTYDTAVGDAILKACSDEDSEAISLARTARIIRKELFSCGHSFDGSLCTSSDDNIVPGSLTALINMILDGPSIKSQARRDVASSQGTRTISELIVFNSVRGGNRPRKENVRHNSDREMPTPVSIGLKVHGKTRNRDLIDCLHKHGLSISYDRVLRISSSIAMSIITRFENDGVVCPPQLKKGLFTTGQVDNIDHNPSATTATDSFHGTAHSLCQHPTNHNSGIDREPIVPATIESEKRIPSLPLAYTNIRPAPPMPGEIKVPTTMKGPCIPPGTTTFDEDRKKEFAWLNKQLKLVEEGEITGDDFVSWAAYHASNHLQSCRPPTSIALMPLFREVAHSFATILHCMDTNRAATHFLNPGQTPVLTMDQPLYAIGKQLQWQFPDLFGESKYVMMMGPHHTEMAALKVIGDLLEGCGWTDLIVQADIATKGTADS